jgi:hypothetical protein
MGISSNCGFCFEKIDTSKTFNWVYLKEYDKMWHATCIYKVKKMLEPIQISKEEYEDLLSV